MWFRSKPTVAAAPRESLSRDLHQADPLIERAKTFAFAIGLTRPGYGVLVTYEAAVLAFAEVIEKYAALDRGDYDRKPPSTPH